MQTLTYGLKRPQTGDTGSIVFTAMEDNITRIDAHDHDGVDSPQLTATSITSISQAITNSGWGSASNGIYSQTVTMTSPYSYDGVNISFRLTSTKEIVYLRCVKASANTYTIFSNDNTLEVTAYYR